MPNKKMIIYKFQNPAEHRTFGCSHYSLQMNDKMLQWMYYTYYSLTGAISTNYWQLRDNASEKGQKGKQKEKKGVRRKKRMTGRCRKDREERK